MSQPAFHTSEKFFNARWSDSRSQARVRTFVIGAESREEVLSLLHLAFPGLRFSAVEVLEHEDSTWTFPVPLEVAAKVLNDRIPFDFTIMDTETGEPALSFVLASGNFEGYGA